MRSHRNIVRIPDTAPEVCRQSPAFVLGAPVDRHFGWLARAEERQKEATAQEQSQQEQPQHDQGGIPLEFPQIVYKTLRFYPDAMKSLARAIREFYNGTYNPYADDPKAA